MDDNKLLRFYVRIMSVGGHEMMRKKLEIKELCIRGISSNCCILLSSRLSDFKKRTYVYI